MKGDTLAIAVGRQFVAEPRQQLGMVLDGKVGAELLPILAEGAHAMRANRDNFRNFAFAHLLQIALG